MRRAETARSNVGRRGRRNGEFIFAATIGADAVQRKRAARRRQFTSGRHCRFGNNRLHARYVDRSALCDGGERNNRRQNLDGERQGKLTSSQESANANRLAQPSLVLPVNEEMTDFNFTALSSSGAESS